LEPIRAQAEAASAMMEDFSTLYSAALEERINALRPTANAPSEVVWGEWTDRKGKRHEGYIRQHLANVSAHKTRSLGYRRQASSHGAERLPAKSLDQELPS
jgi:hypothetical protein